MGEAERTKDLLTASRLAGFCQVDLKTIHNWAERGCIAHFRTPGRHLRFRREDVLDFLRKYGYPIPQEVAAERPCVALMLDEAPERLAVKEALESHFEVLEFPDAIAGLLAIGQRPPDALVLGARVGPLDGGQIIGALRQSEHAQHVRAVLVTHGMAEGSERHQALRAGASARVRVSNLCGLRDTLEALMGMRR